MSSPVAITISSAVFFPLAMVSKIFFAISDENIFSGFSRFSEKFICKFSDTDAVSMGKNSSKISRAERVHLASQALMSWLQPSLVGRKISPGTAKTSFPSSSASCAVMSVPLFAPASGMRTASEKPATISLRMGKLKVSGSLQIGKIDKSPPPECKIFSKRFLLVFG